MKKILVLFCLIPVVCLSQISDEAQLEKIYKTALTEAKSYGWLDYLSNQIGGRLSGSLNAERAVKYTKEEMEKLGLDGVYLQPVMVPKWTRGIAEYAYFETAPGMSTQVNICALGGSVATPVGGLKSGVIEVKGVNELVGLGKESIEGKIVFYNRSMQADVVNTFEAYGGCVDQRYAGAAEAAKYGALGVIVRSMNLRIDDLPHTGSMSYGDLPVGERIPAAAISTKDAELLSSMLTLNPNIKFHFRQTCKVLIKRLRMK